LYGLNPKNNADYPSAIQELKLNIHSAKGEKMNIRYGAPLSRGWERMSKALFKPFDLGKWFAAGFTAFLAGLADGFGNNGSSYIPGKDDWNLDKITEFPGIAWQWLLDNPFWSGLIICGILLLIALGILLLWLSSRGKFMFLDNVVHDRALVSKPWDQFRYLGDSLFLWRLCFGIIVFAVVCLFITVAVFVFNLFHNNDFSSLATGLTISGMVLWFFAIGIITAYISLFLSHFVVPIMYKNNIGAVDAWQRFMSLLSGYMLNFIFYGMIILLLNILIGLCIMVIGLFTCCIGLIIISIPYIGTVILLPVKYTFRALSVEFLEQFGPDYEIFPKQDDEIFGVYEL
jgi:MFS family permease